MRKTKITQKESPSELKTYWMALKLQEWSDIGLESTPHLPFPVQFKEPDGDEIGFLPVFSTMEGALKFVNYNRNLIGKIREVKR
jgi:hypothetical protein